MPLEPNEFFGKHAAEFDDANKLDELPGAFRRLLETFEAELTGSTILDAGCGPGRDTEYFHTNGHTPVGIDISKTMIDRARRTRPGTYHQMDIRQLSFDTATFDGVWCPASVYFLPPAEMQVALSEFRRVLTHDGVLSVAFKLGDGKTTQDRWGDSVTEYHLDGETAEAYIEANGFSIVDTQTHSNPDRTFKNILCRCKSSTAAD
jgi:ubiquinone/menaquinone biosynthesis C-methylase UbiE